MCARKADLLEEKPEEKLEEKPEEKPESEEKKPEPVADGGSKGEPAPDPLAETVSKMAASMDRRMGQLERFLKQTKEKAEKAPLLGSLAKALSDPDEWMPDFLREPKKPENPQ